VSYDVIVVGAGPSGSLLAHYLASSGVSVLLLEKARFPRYKVCGGGLTQKTIRAIPFDISSVIEKDEVGGCVTFGGRLVMRMEVKPAVASLVMRDRFDALLAHQAQRAGAHLVEGEAVTKVTDRCGWVEVVTASSEYAARVVAGADGVNSTVARCVGLLASRRVGVALQAEIPVDQASLDLQGNYATFDFGALPWGYGWVFPKRGHVSAGVFQARQKKVPRLRWYLDRFLASQAALRGGEPFRVQGHLIPLGGTRETLHRGSVLLVGDAANLADPWLGEGIYYAVRSGKIAAEVILDALAADRPRLDKYTIRVQAEIGRELAAAARLARAVYQWPRVGSNLIKRSPSTRQVILAAMRGDIRFSEVNRTFVRRVPRLLQEVLFHSGATSGGRT
jgi:geranylgeranyl reductase family protein